MFKTDQYCYVDMNKTGSVYLNNKLKTLNKNFYYKHHELPSKAIINDKNCIKFGTVRDPWSWYVSIWSYGCEKKVKSGLYNNLTRFRPFKSYGNVKNKIKAIYQKQIAFLSLNFCSNINTKELYSDASNPELFRKWLKIILNDKFIPAVDYQLYNSKLFKHCGLYTKRLIKFYFLNHKINNGIIDLTDGLSDFLEQNCYIDDFIVTNKLDADLKSFFAKYKFHQEQPYVISKKLNSASKNISHYNQETFKLVLEKEKIVLDYFLNYWKIDLFKNINEKKD